MLFIIEMRVFFSLLLYFFLLSIAYPQDTLFVNKHLFPSPVQNVFEARETVFAKTTLNLYQLDGDTWTPIQEDFSKPYVFYKNNFYESDFIPNSELFDVNPIKELVPQRGQFIATAARVGSRFFIATGSELFEYEIRDHYTRTYHNMSIRDIYIEDSLKVILTYSGIYVNDSIRLEYPEYSNGPLAKIDSLYYLPWDEVSLFFPPDSIYIIPNATNLFSGKARKVISWKGENYALYTQSVSKILPEFELQPIHQGLEYLDLEVFGEDLVFSTFEGICLTWDGEKIDTLAQIPAKVKDIFPIGNRLIFSSDAGVFELNADNPKLTQLADTPNSVMTTLDDFNNLWISTENGLYVLSSDYPDPILIIPNVEFNREALLLQGEMLYVGAVDGLYQLNTYEIEKSYLPNLLNTLQVPLSERKSTWLIGGALAVLGFLIGFILFRKKRKEDLVNARNGSKNEWSLEELENRILSEKIQTVEALALSFETNTVQLNRNFKKLGTTPGKFLKQVKLKQAKEMIQDGKDLEEVAKAIGYSTKLIKTELNLD
ncbi:AraC family transcriptional regulator [Algoriphagus kandeliae]|uniref:AraC family transcriptional regulator n=1 Tax=Algoriphagus kandeliae TaxID=2562278 RepID=A0A4Y9QUR7_9BACT|nr:helix-turn-helix domain-containing protein [Algoriphagus kandeliae]TFV95840.1 AraC family transcriptional regulator [Algoriphagus kandeliae]